MQGWSHIALNHPLSFLQHQLFCRGRLTWLHLGARQISACESLNSRNSPKGMWGRRRRGGEHIKPRICYSQSLKAAHAKAGVTKGRNEGLLLSTGTWITSALLYSQSGNSCAIALSRKQPTLYIFGEFLLGVREAGSDHLIPSVLLNRNCSWVPELQVVLSHIVWFPIESQNALLSSRLQELRHQAKLSPKRRCPPHRATCLLCGATRKGG